MHTSEPLYRRLGGPEGIASIVDDIVVAHMQNPTIKARFLPILSDPARLAVIKKHTCQFLEMGGGGRTAEADDDVATTGSESTLITGRSDDGSVAGPPEGTGDIDTEGMGTGADRPTPRPR